MLSIGSLRNALSAERLSAYGLPGDTDEVDSVARYLWNLALCSALQPAESDDRGPACLDPELRFLGEPVQETI